VWTRGNGVKRQRKLAITSLAEKTTRTRNRIAPPLSTVGWRSRHKIARPPVEEEGFFLTSLFIELIDLRFFGEQAAEGSHNVNKHSVRERRHSQTSPTRG